MPNIKSQVQRSAVTFWAHVPWNCKQFCQGQWNGNIGAPVTVPITIISSYFRVQCGWYYKTISGVCLSYIWMQIGNIREFLLLKSIYSWQIVTWYKRQGTYVVLQTSSYCWKGYIGTFGHDRWPTDVGSSILYIKDFSYWSICVYLVKAEWT